MISLLWAVNACVTKHVHYFRLLRKIRMLEADLDKVTPDDLKEVTTYTVHETHSITRTEDVCELCH